jgi:hypothetical protein
LRRGVAAAALLASLAWLPIAAAQSGGASGPAAGEPVFIELISSDGCGTSQDLVRRVMLRSQRVQLVPRANAVVIARAEIQGSAGGSVSATLTLIQPIGKRWSRQVRSASCDEVLDAIALVLAVIFDPTVAIPVAPARPPPPAPPRARPQPAPEVAKRQPRPSPPETVEIARAAEPTPLAPLEPRVQRDAELPPMPAPAPRPDLAPEPPPQPEGAAGRERKLSWLAGLGGLGSWGPTPRAIPGITLFLMLDWSRPSIWSPAAQVTAAHFESDGFAAPGGTADFALDMLGLDLCPIWLRHRRFGARLCATGAAGQLTAAGSQTSMPQSHVRPFAMLGGSAILTVELKFGIQLRGWVAGAGPLIRDSFQFVPEVFHRVPPLVLTVGAGIGVRFL